MISLKATYNKRALPALAQYMRDYTRLAERQIQQEADTIGRATVAQLRQPVSRVQYPIQWASERQRKAYFATDGFGGGIPTRRTGASLKAWRYEFKRTGKGYTFAIFNSKPWSKFLFGSLAQDARQARRFQQPMHTNTGYPLASPIVSRAMDTFAQQIKRNVIRAQVQEIKRRAFTGR